MGASTVSVVTAQEPGEARRGSFRGRENQPDTRQRILDATLRLLGDRGFHGFGMREVAELADTTTGSIYHFFDDKHALVDTTVRHFGERIAGELIAAVSGAADGLAALRAVVRSVALASEPGWRRWFHLAMIAEAARTGSPDVPPMAELLRGPIIAAVAADELVLDDGVHLDELVDLVAAGVAGLLQVAETPIAATPGGRLVELFVESVIAAHRSSPAVRPEHTQVRS
jgi:AcrR family transcriptional regulator